MRTIDVHEAKANLFKLVEQAAKGESFLIAISGTPRVMVLPLESREAGHVRRHGLLERCLVFAAEVDPRGEAEIEIITATRSVRNLKGIFGKPIESASIEAMNRAIAIRGAKAR